MRDAPVAFPIRARLRTAQTLLRGSGLGLSVIVGSVLAQRLLLPFAALELERRTPAAVALLLAAALGLVRALAADGVARKVRLALLELYLTPFERGPISTLPPPEVVTARLGTALPRLVACAIDGLAPTLAALVAIPIVASILVHALGVAVLVPVGLAGIVGALVTLSASRRMVATWTDAWARSRTLFISIAAGYEGAIDLRAHGRAGAHAERLRVEMRAWCDAERSGRLATAISTWGAFGATIATAGTVVALSGDSLVPHANLYRTLLVVVAAIPTLQTLITGTGSILTARDDLDAAGRQLRLTADALPPEADEPLDAAAEIRLEGVGYAYPGNSDATPIVAVDAVDLVLPPRRSIAITGPNGAGKTTLIHLLLGVVKPDRGRILVGGREARLDNRSFRARIAYLSQRPFEQRQASLAANLRAFDASPSDERLLDALRAVGLYDLLRARVSTDSALLALSFEGLSRGQARRVMLARALLRDADLLVLDEPEAHLDAASVTELIAVLVRVARERRIVAVVHDRQLFAFADQVIELAAPVAGEKKPSSVDVVASAPAARAS